MAKVALPLWAKVASLLTLALSLLLLVLGVVVGTHGQIDLSNDLAALALLSMAIFAGVSLSQERVLARKGVTSNSAEDPDLGAPAGK